jgi:O-antigen ligase
MDVIFVIGLGLLLPLVHLPLGLRLSLWIFIGLFPLYMYHKSMFVLVGIAGKSIQLPTLTKDLVCTILVAVLLVILLIRSKKEKWPFLGLFAAFAIFAAFLMATSIIQGNSLMKTIMGVRSYTFFSIAGLLMGSFLLRNEYDLKRLVNLLLGGITAIGFIALMHVYVDDSLLILDCFQQLWNGKLIPWGTYSEGLRLHSIFTAPNVLGNFMALGIILSLWKIINRYHTYPVIIYYIIIVLFMWILILTLSRSALLALIGASLVMIMIITGKIPKLSLLIMVLFMIGLLAFTPVGERFSDTDVLDNPRLLLWGIFIHASISSWRYFILGHGAGSIGTFGAEQSFAEDIKDPRLSFLNAGVGKGETFVVDNAFVRCLYEIGVVGIIIMVFLVGVILWYSLKTMRNGNQKTRQNLSIALTICAFIIILSFFGDMLITYPWNFLFWFLFPYIMRSKDLNEVTI